jgi:glyoxylase-like metal-dependent hydrolase (beta-lactamase superfamily II)
MSNITRSDAPTRRDFLTLVSSAASLAFVPNPFRTLLRLQEPESAFRWERLSNDVRVAYGSGGNSLAVIRGRDALLIDTKVAAFGQVLAHELQSFGATARTVINTHHHGDHSGGNDAFTGTADVVAQARAKPRAVKSAEESLARLKGATVDRYAAGLRESGFDVRVTELVQRDVEQFVAGLDRITPESFAPTTTVDVQRELRAAGYTVQLEHVTPSHTDNDLIVYLPELDLLHAGDLLFNGHHTFVDVSAGASTRGWDRSLAAAIAMCKPTTRVIAGHGPVTDRAGLQRQREYFDRLRDAATAAIRDGKSRAEVAALKPAAVANLAWPALLADTLGVVYDELTANG